MKAVLLTDIQKTVTSIEVQHTDAILEFDSTGGYGYIGLDYFSYTSIVGYIFNGVTGLRYSHEAGEEVSPTFGVTISSLIPVIEKNQEMNPDGLTEVIAQIIDSYYDDLKRYNLGLTRLSDPTSIPSDYLKHYCMSIGIEYDENATEGIRRRLALTAIDLLKSRGSLAAFKFITWHVLGYDVDVDVIHSKIPTKMNQREYHLLQPTYIMPIDDRSVGLWDFTNLTGTSCPNSVTGGPTLELESAAMVAADASCMFSKGVSLNVTLAHPYATIDGSVSSKCNLHGKEEFAIELFLDPATSLAFPQTILSKGTMLKISRTDLDNIKIDMSNGTDTDTLTVQDIITSTENQLLSIIYTRPTITICVNGQVVKEATFFDYSVIDDGSQWVIGDITGANPYIGKLDTPHISVGLKRATEVYSYWEHIDILRSYVLDPDRNNYMYVINHKDGYAEITINNDDGDDEKHTMLDYLISEWLGIGGYSVIYTGNLPLEERLGFVRL